MGKWNDGPRDESIQHPDQPHDQTNLSDEKPTAPRQTRGQQQQQQQNHSTTDSTTTTTTTYATKLPMDIPYNETFDNSLQQVLTHPPPPGSRDGITILDDSSTPEPGVSVRAADIDPSRLPTVAFDELPLPLDDPRRVYTSRIPGVRLTHPSGYLEGGPGLTPDNDVFAQKFISDFNIEDVAALKEIREREIRLQLAEAARRMKARQEALRHNARIEKEIKTLIDQREMELKIENNMRDEQKAKAERREKRRLKNAG